MGVKMLFSDFVDSSGSVASKAVAKGQDLVGKVKNLKSSLLESFDFKDFNGSVVERMLSLLPNREIKDAVIAAAAKMANLFEQGNFTDEALTDEILTETLQPLIGMHLKDDTVDLVSSLTGVISEQED